MLQVLHKKLVNKLNTIKYVFVARIWKIIHVHRRGKTVEKTEELYAKPNDASSAKR